MTSLIAIALVFGISALALLALLVSQVRGQLAKRAEQARTERTAKRLGDKAALPPIEPERPAQRTRVISAAPLAEAEAHLSPRLGTLAAAARGETAAAALPDAILAAGRQAIVLRRHFPPHLAQGSRSFYGGVPQVPGPFAWPHDPDSGKPLHFILQLDLAEVPEQARLGLLPASGALLFFLDLQWGNGQTGAVLWAEGGDVSAWPEVDPPASLSLAYGDEGAYAWPWALAAEHGIPLLPRWPFQPVLVPLPEAGAEGEEADEEDDAHTPPSWHNSKANEQALLAAQTGGATDGALPHQFGPQDFTGPDGDQFIPPWPGFPQDWLAVQTCAAALVREADRALRFPRRSLYPDLDDAARAAHLAAVKEEAQAWFDHALANPALGAIDPPVRAAFWDWFAGHKPLTQLIAPSAVEAAIETTLHASPQEAGKIPPEVVARVACRHVLAQRTAQGDIHAPTPNRLLAPYSDVQGDQQERAASHLLLLELSSDEAIGHRFGEGVYQFWITPEDLAERRFDKAVLTTTAY